MSSIVASGPVAVGERAHRQLGRRQSSLAGRPALRLAAMAGAGLLAAALVLRVLVGPFAAVRHVVVSGDSPLPEQEILRAAGLVGGEGLVALDTGLIASRLEAIPTVRTARVVKQYPGTVRIALQRRNAVALVFADDGGRSRVALVDSDGVVFATLAAGVTVDLPVVSGLAARVGERLPRGAAPLLADLAALRQRSPSLFRLVSEVSLEAASAAGRLPLEAAPTGPLDYLLYLASAPVPLRGRGSIDGRLLQYALLVVDLLSSQGKLGDIRELDLRGGEVICRMKEG